MSIALMGAIAGLVIAGCAVLGVLAAIIRWFFQRGAQEADMARAIRENTGATKGLTDAFHGFRESTMSQLQDFNVRLGRVEVLQNGLLNGPHVSRTADHDASAHGGNGSG